MISVRLLMCIGVVGVVSAEMLLLLLLLLEVMCMMVRW